MKKVSWFLFLVSFLSGMAWAETTGTLLFPHCVTIQFNGCTTTEPLENFPVPVKIAEGQPFGFSYEDCTVDTFRFTDTYGNILPHDVECWNTDGTSIIWVSVPALSKGAVIYFRYGEPTTELSANTPSEVWTRAGYAGVWHMNEASGMVADAAGSNLTATPKEGAASLGAVDGPIGNGRCTATSGKGYLSIPNYDSLGLGSTFTISAWVKMSAVNGYSRIFSRKTSYANADGWEIEMQQNSKTAFTARAASNSKILSGTMPDLMADWRLLTLAYSEKTLSVFADGVLVKSGTVDPTMPDNGQPLSLGNNSNGSETGLLGSFDEARLRRTPSSSVWTATEYESVRKADFATYSPVDQAVQNVVSAKAVNGGLVKVDSGEAASSAVSEGVALGTSLTATVTAIPSEGYRFLRWTGNVDLITAGSVYSPSITVTTTVGAALAAEFVSLTGDDSYIQITNAFDHPSGGFFTATYSSALTVNTFTLIAFTSPEDAPAGLREFYHPNNPDSWNSVGTGLTDDWGFFKSFAVATTEASTQTTVQFAAAGAEKAGLTDYGVYTYAGSWYVPADATYSFRMHMHGKGQLVLDNQIILQQKSDGSAVTTNNVALARGWHNFYAVFLARDKKVAPADAAVCGLLFSAVNADLASAPSQGRAFATEDGENAHRLSTAYNGVLVPSIWAAGGDVLIDCANALGDLRVAGQLGSLAHSFEFVNLPAGRTLEVGRPANFVQSGYQGLDTFAWIDWSRTTIPAGVNVRAEGAVALDKPIPAGHGYSLGKCVTLATTIPDLFGIVAAGATEFHLPKEIVALLVGSPSVLGDTAKIHVGKNQGFASCGSSLGLTDNNKLPFRFSGSSALTFKNDLELASGAAFNGTAAWNDAAIWGGSIQGAGWVGMTGWGRRMNITGRVVAETFSSGQRGCRMNLRPRADYAASRIGTLSISDEKSAQPDNGWDYFPASLFFCPQGEGAPPLSVGTVSGGGVAWYSAQATRQRGGSTISTCSNNTISVTSFKGSGYHLRTVIPGGTADDPVEGGDGPANFVVGAIDSAMSLYISSNVNITVTNVNQAVAFHYEVNSNGVNDAVLDIEGACTASTITATDVAMLPARVKGFVGEVTLTQTETKTYPIVVDFSKSAPNHGGCDGSGTLVAAPAGGAIEVMFAGETATAGDYGLVRFTDVGNLLDGWTATAPTFYEGHSVKLVKDSTGFWLQVRKSGITIIIR